jgi:lysophospholipase L1-like esterase
MKRYFKLILIIPFLLMVLGIQYAADHKPVKENSKIIAVMGSSVAAGWVTSREAAYDHQNGYAQRLGRLLEPRGYKVVNISKPGDTTEKVLKRLEKDLLPLNPDFVILGLSLENEGIRGIGGKDPEKVFSGFKENMMQITKKCRDSCIVPVIASCYISDYFDAPEHYEYTKKMNIQINTWDVPSINLMGALDNGSGRFVKGYTFDFDHPNSRGHEEMFYTIVPSLFEALDVGKPQPVRQDGEGFVTIKRNKEGIPLSYIPEDIIHSFSFGFSFRSAFPGALGAVLSENTHSVISIDQKGSISYKSGDQSVISQAGLLDNNWHEVVLSHRYAKGESLLYVDGKPVGTVPERLIPLHFVLGGAGEKEKQRAPELADYRDMLVFRSALTMDEIDVLSRGKLLQSSLEIYAPLSDGTLGENILMINLSQSLSQLRAYPTDVESSLGRLHERIEIAKTREKIFISPEEKKIIQIDPEILQAYVGKYEVAPGDFMEISIDEDRLIFSDRGRKEILHPFSEIEFVIKTMGAPVDVRILFTKDKEGRTTSLILQISKKGKVQQVVKAKKK